MVSRQIYLRGRDQCPCMCTLIHPSDVDNGKGQLSWPLFGNRRNMLTFRPHTHLCPLPLNHWDQSINLVLILYLRLGAVFLPFLVIRARGTNFSNAFPFALSNLMQWLFGALLRISLGTRLGSSRMAFILSPWGNEVPQGKQNNNNRPAQGTARLSRPLAYFAIYLFL